jgi:hypothetical protein
MRLAHFIGMDTRQQTGLSLDGLSEAFIGNIPGQDGIKQAIDKVHGSFSLFVVEEKQAQATYNEKRNQQWRIDIKQHRQAGHPDQSGGRE